MGDDAAAQRYLRHEIFNRSDDDRAPLDPSARTAEVIDRIIGTAHADAAQDHALPVGSPIHLRGFSTHQSRVTQLRLGPFA